MRESFTFSIPMDNHDKIKSLDRDEANRQRISTCSSSRESKITRRTILSSTLVYVHTYNISFYHFSLFSHFSFSFYFFLYQRRNEFECLISESSEEEEETMVNELMPGQKTDKDTNMSNSKLPDTNLYEDIDEAIPLKFLFIFFLFFLSFFPNTTSNEPSLNFSLISFESSLSL